jgi:hypothetical protein
VQPKGVVEGVAGFVPQDAHAFDVGAAFNLAHELALEFHQPRMGQVKRDGKSGHAVGREPFGRQPHVRLEANAAIVQLAVEPFDVRFDERTFDTNRKIADASVQQSLI